MKTAKETCGDIKEYKQKLIDDDINEIIYFVMHNGGKAKFFPGYNVATYRVKLEELGYTVESKISVTRYPGVFPWSKADVYEEPYYVVSANCECKDE